MQSIDKIFFINLDRCRERKEHFYKQCEIHKIPLDKVERVPAVDGMKHSFNPTEQRMFKRANYQLNPENITKKIMGNQLSHFYTLKHIIAKNYKYSLIVQDDVMFREGFVKFVTEMIVNLPENTEIVNLSLHKKADGKEFIAWDFKSDSDSKSDSESDDSEIICRRKINDYVGVWNEECNPCSLAYIITLQGAKNIVTYFEMFGFRETADCNYNKYLQNKDIFYGSSKVMATTNTDFESDIFR
jgi:GR25 family glycosyltransferase involved in LPS biosynthesis